MAGEFFVLACLHRLGVEAYLTLGNTKAVDIVVRRQGGSSLTIDVKSVADRADYWVSQPPDRRGQDHIVVFLSFDGRIADPLASPTVWVVPFDSLRPHLRAGPAKDGGTWVGISRSQLDSDLVGFRNNWQPILGSAPRA